MSDVKQDRPLNKMRVLLSGKLVWIILVALLLFSFVASPYFRNPINLTNVLKQSIGLGIAAVGQTFVILSGGIDLSIGSMISLMTTLIAGGYTNNPEASMLVLILMTLGIGLASGMLNSFIIIKLNVTPFIATLGTMSMLQGIVLFYSKISIGGVPKNFRFISEGTLVVIPFSILLFIVLLAAAYLILNRHKIGRHIYAVGANQYVAQISGIAVDRIKFFAYTMCGLFAGIASVYLSARLGAGGPRIGMGYELDSITAVVIGGVSLAGGVGSVIAAFGGVLILSVFNNIMNLLGVNPFYQIVLKGVILILAVSFNKKK
jgi:ribose/xylose/arabinose/galactoside ABC-type transport system permease subunit